MPNILLLGQDGNSLWIGIDTKMLVKRNLAAGTVLGHDCSSIKELESVADQIRADLDRILTEARAKFPR